MWNSGVRLAVWQTWWVGQDVICSPGSCCRIGVLPPGIWTALVKLDQWGLQSSHLIARASWEGCPGLQQHLPEAIPNAYVELFPLGHKDEPALWHLPDLVQHCLVCGPDPHLLEPQPKSNMRPTAQSIQSSQDFRGQKVTLGRYPSLSGSPQVRGVKGLEVSTLGSPRFHRHRFLHPVGWW